MTTPRTELEYNLAVVAKARLLVQVDYHRRIRAVALQVITELRGCAFSAVLAAVTHQLLIPPPLIERHITEALKCLAAEGEITATVIGRITFYKASEA